MHGAADEPDALKSEVQMLRAELARYKAAESETLQAAGMFGQGGAATPADSTALNNIPVPAASEQLLGSEARLRAIFDALPDCVKIFDSEGRIVHINPGGLDLLQAQDLASLSKPGYSPVPPEYLPACHAVHADVISGQPVVWEYEIVGLQGRRRHVEAHSVPFQLPDGSRAHLCISRDNTERKNAEILLRRNEERLRLVQEATGLAEFEAGPSGIVEFTERLCEQVGVPKETHSFSFSEWLQIVHPEDREHLQAVIRSSLASDETFESEFRIVRADTGETRWISSRTKMERDASGRAIRTIGAHFDITERKRAEEALRDSEERFRLAAEAAGLGVWDYDPESGKREWSERLKEILGFSPDTQPSLELAVGRIHPDERSQFMSISSELLNDREAGRFEQTFRILRAVDEAERWITVNGWKTRKGLNAHGRIILTVRDVTDEKTSEQRFRWTASHDALTGLANRALFQERLDAAIASAAASRGQVGLLLLDMDRFKQINDTLGHDAGDVLLKMFAERLQGIFRSEDTVARFGGDEFAVILPNLKTAQSLTNLTDSVLDRLREPFVYAGRILDCRASIGASVFPDHGPNAQELVKNADVALYSAKSAGRGTSIIFEPQLRADLQRRNMMIQTAREAVRCDRVIPYYQPKLDLANGSIIGFEALLRWRAPNGRIHLARAIHAAFEDLDVAAEISDRMIERTIADMRGWLDKGTAFEHVAVNASAAEFRRDNFAERVLDQLTRANIPTQCFQLEVTETVFLGRGAEYVHRALELLSSSGVRIALDDFGTGYASLRHLKQFPVDIMKIDRTFVRGMKSDPGDEAIIRAVINLGRSLGIKVVAEGIETQEQVEHLVRLRCDYGQGFLFSKAVPASRVPALTAQVPSRSDDLKRGLRSGLRLVSSN
jgi:diguanylate cyclase (GGDEF)-like protein/PAS domain S-box-containing protein